MADAFRGLTLRIGADARPLASAINSINKSAGDAQASMRRLSKALNFDTTNVKAMGSRLDLAGDKAAMAATSARMISRAIDQASTKTIEFSKRSGIAGGKMAQLASSTSNMNLALNRVRQQYNHIDTELETIYDSCIAVARVKLDMGLEKATAHVNNLKSALSKGGDEAKKARAELVSLMKSAAFKTDIMDQFGLKQKTIGDVHKLIATWDKLRAAQKDYESDLAKMKSIAGFREAQVQLTAFESELRNASSEVTQFRAEMYSIGGANGLADAVAKAKQLDAAVDAAAASSKNMTDAFKAAPMSFEAARAKAVAFMTEQQTLKSKLEAVNETIDKIGASKGFDRQRAMLSDVWTAAEKAKSRYTELHTKLEVLKADYDSVSASIKEVKGSENSLSTQARQNLAQDTALAARLERQIDQVEQEIRQADAAVKSTQLDRRFREASEEAVQLKSRIQQVNAQLRGMKNYQQAFEGLRRIGYGLYTTLTQALTRVGRYAIQSANDIDAAYRDMRKTVNGTEEEFEHLKDAALNFSRTHVTSADQILEIEAIGGQLGISARNLEQFGTTVSNLDIATNMDTEDIALNLAKLSNIMHFGQDQYDSFADALVRLGNNEPALESDIMQIATRFAGMGANVDMATSDVLAFATAATATGQKAAAAGGAMQRTIGRIEKAVDSGGEALESYAAISGMTAEEFANTWNDKSDHGPARAMQAFVEGLKRVKEGGGSVTNTLAGIGITGVRDMQLLSGLTNTTDVLSDSLRMADDAWNGMSTVMGDGTIELAGDAAREAGRKAEGFSGQLAIMQNNAQMLGSVLAEGATPIIKMLSDAFQGLTEVMQTLPSGVKTGIVAIGGILAAIGPVIVGLGAMGSAVTGIGEAFKSIRSFSILKDAAKSVSGLVSSFRLSSSAATAASSATSIWSTAIGAEGVQARIAAASNMANASSINASGKAAGGATSVMSRLKGAITGLTGSFGLSMAVIAGVGLVIGLVAKGFMDQAQRAQDAKNATEGWSEAISASTPSLSRAKGSMDDYAKSIEGTFRGVEELVEAQLKLKDAIIERNETAQGDINQLAAAQDAISKYMNKTNLTAKEQGELARAIEIVNDACGTQYEVVDIVNGKIADESGALLDTCGAIDEYIRKKQLQIKAEALAADAAEVQQQKEDAAKDVAAYGKELSNVNAEIAKMESATDAQKSALYELNGEWVPYSAYLQSLYADQSRLNYEIETATGVYNENDEALNGINNQLSNLYEYTEGYSRSLSTMVGASGEWTGVFQNWGADIDTFAQALDQTTLTTEQFGEITGEQIQKMAELWAQGGMTIDEVLAAAGVSVGSFGEQFAGEVSRVGVDFESLAQLLGSDTETLAGALKEAGYSAIDMSGMTADSLALAAEAAMNAENPVQAFIDKLNEIGSADTDVNMDTSDVEDAEGDIEGLSEEIEEIPEGEVTMDTSDLPRANEEILGTIKLVEDGAEGKATLIPETDDAMQAVKAAYAVTAAGAEGTAKIVAKDDATWRIQAIQNTLNAITAVSHVVRITAVKEGEFATGGIAPGGIRANARGGIFDTVLARIPLHADGGINGIVTRPTLTNIGLVGEAGDEALLHMKHAGGAVIPLSNRRHVRPFAQAVASEMAGVQQAGGINVSVTVNAKTDADADAIASITARKVKQIFAARGR